LQLLLELMVVELAPASLVCEVVDWHLTLAGTSMVGGCIGDALGKLGAEIGALGPVSGGEAGGGALGGWLGAGI